jgi:hypothetical protein
MNLSTSTPVRLALVATLVCATVAVLRPEPVEIPEAAPPRTITDKTRRADPTNPAHYGGPPWQRALLPEPEAVKETPEPTTGLPPLPTQAALTADTGHTPPLPSPTASAPEPPQIVYLGRMIRDNDIQVFLASHDQTSVVREGDVVDGIWQVQSVSSSQVTLRNTQSGTTRVIAMGDSATASPTEVKTVQIGPHFLASNPVQTQAPN